MTKKILFILIFSFIFCAAIDYFVAASEDSKHTKVKGRVRAGGEEILSGPVMIKFFHSPSCPPCVKIKQNFLPQIESKYKDKIAIEYHDISNKEEFELKLAMEKEYGILRGLVPEIFLPTAVLEGKNAIEKDLVNLIEEALERRETTPTKKAIPKENLILNKFSTFSPAMIAFVGLADGINPCAFATMVFFVSFLSLNSYRKSEISYIGSAFIVGVFLTYLGLGLGIFHAFRKLQLFSFWSRLIYFAVAFLALALGIYNLCEYIKYKRTGQMKGCSLKLYERLRSITNNRKTLIILIITAFINGFIVALLESACTGQVYFPIIAFVAKIPNLRLHALLFLILYNLAFILPLVIIFLLAYKGATSESFSLFTNKHFAGIKLTYTFLFFALAILLFLF
ncbi:MAG: hypothetical protein ISS43_02865 [Candidatus Omnitrophica bacterium]|nr:hypothetical protein [Candidatus Omnitrophota bacterium]